MKLPLFQPFPTPRTPRGQREKKRNRVPRENFPNSRDNEDSMGQKAAKITEELSLFLIFHLLLKTREGLPRRRNIARGTFKRDASVISPHLLSIFSLSLFFFLFLSPFFSKETTHERVINTRSRRIIVFGINHG